MPFTASVIFQIEVGCNLVPVVWSCYWKLQSWSASMKSRRVAGPLKIAGVEETGVEWTRVLSASKWPPFPPNFSRDTGLLDCLRLFLGATCTSAQLLLYGITTRNIMYSPPSLKWKNSSILKLQVTSMQDNDSGKQFHFSHAKIFRKGWSVSKENDPIKKYIYLFSIHPSGTFPILQSHESGLLELSSYVRQVTFCISYLWRPPIEKTWEISARNHNRLGIFLG